MLNHYRVKNRFAGIIIDQEKYGRNGTPGGHKQRAVKTESLLEKIGSVGKCDQR